MTLTEPVDNSTPVSGLNSETAMDPEMLVVRPDAVAAVLARRSFKHLREPGPSGAQLETILAAATTAPDHNELHPWRFVVVAGDERGAFGDALVDAGVDERPDLPDAHRDKLRSKAFVAPVFVVIVFSPRPGNVELWEQEASASAAGYAMVLTAHLLGVGSMWKSAPFRHGVRLAELLDLRDDELLLGWVNLGTPAASPRDRRHPIGPEEAATVLRGGRAESWSHAVYEAVSHS